MVDKCDTEVNVFKDLEDRIRVAGKAIIRKHIGALKELAK